MVLDSFYEYNISTNVLINEQIYMFYEIWKMHFFL